MAYTFDGMIEISNSHTNIFGYQRQFCPQFTLKLRLAWKVFDCSLRI